MRSRAAVVLLLVWLPLTPPLALASPGTAPKCSQVEYRTEHLAECNRQGDRGVGIGGGGNQGDGGGLLGGLGRLVRRIL